MPSSKGSFHPRDQTCVSCDSCMAGRFFTTEPPGKLPLVIQFSHSAVSNPLQPHEPQIPGLPVYHQLPESTQTHVIESVMP